MYDKREYDENVVKRDRCCMLPSRKTCTILVNIILHCKRLQDYVKSIIKDDKNVLKNETILQKNHQDSKSCIQNISKPYQLLSSA